jgi:HD superfamily phosphodiesterase
MLGWERYMSELVAWARERAEILLAPLGNRWLHVQGVASVAETTAKIFDKRDADYLIASAYLHDIGYAPQLVVTGFHPLDGANYIMAELGDKRLASLVAHHSGARFEATLRGIAHELLDTFPWSIQRWPML